MCCFLIQRIVINKRSLWSRVQGLHPSTSEICFSVVPSSNLRSSFANSQLVCLLPVGTLNYVLCYVYFKYLFILFQWHASELARLSAFIAKCMTNINIIYLLLLLNRFSLSQIRKKKVMTSLLVASCFFSISVAKKLLARDMLLLASYGQ